MGGQHHPLLSAVAKCLAFSLRSSKERVVLATHLSAEGRVPPGTIFREKIEGRWYRM
jgi:hypothetical protein